MFTLGDILQQANKEDMSVHISGTLAPNPEMIFREAHHDSRQVKAGDLFIALKGEKVDGHDYIASAARAGARAALCARPVADIPPGFLQIIVPDVIKALHATAHARTQRQPETLYLGITGSNGKTSTKEAIAAILERSAPTLKTLASYNTEIGYPLTLLRLEPQHRYAVLEMGAQWVGELTMLSRVTRPTWSLITNVGSSHLGYFGSPEQIAIAKSELVQALAPDGLALLNYDDLRVRAMSAQTSAPVLYYGQGEGADVRATDIAGDSLFGRRFTLRYKGEEMPIQLHIPGEHGITIALAAAAVGCAAGISLDEIRQALEALKPAKRRGEIKPGPNGSTLIDDSYNANRQSILAIAQAMHDTTLASGGRRWAVLGDILELGKYSREEHRACGAALAPLVDSLVAIGEQARFYVEGALDAGMPSENAYFYSADIENSAELEAAKRAAADLLKAEIRSSDLVLIKASLGLAMDTLINQL
ncbi:UDP-N-acetylmuramoyl-tripeptide--D-alanyl-D-alanine ligase [Ktedonospora formicarum]|uniref:UDP-N-acetylmuramoyl-tripeptide--D-alanyl-D-alanine ligase n=2 Tax=Ktedonospora formicarum TaxID=2778364 RepID=A0A8J3HTK7_9CHLR|nr:UDP-N-acetylmuramoyl-tripeptide--D-alanyl-D-alanine ligase [Ktedonospora formicarum]